MSIHPWASHIHPAILPSDTLVCSTQPLQAILPSRPSSHSIPHPTKPFHPTSNQAKPSQPQPYPTSASVSKHQGGPKENSIPAYVTTKGATRQTEATVSGPSLLKANAAKRHGPGPTLTLHCHTKAFITLTARIGSHCMLASIHVFLLAWLHHTCLIENPRPCPSLPTSTEARQNTPTHDRSY